MPIQGAGSLPHAEYEANVFNFLLANREFLGIVAVLKFQGLLVDRAVELTTGQRLAVEVKYRMNLA